MVQMRRLLTVILIIYTITIAIGDDIVYTNLPDNIFGINGSRMTKERLIHILKKNNAKYRVLVNEPPDYWIGSTYFIGEGLEEFKINYIIYSFPDIGEYNFEIAVEFDIYCIDKILKKLKKILGSYNIGIESFSDRSEYYYWISKNKNKSGGIKEIFIIKKSLFPEKNKINIDYFYLNIKWARKI